MAISDAQYTAWLKSQSAVRCILVEVDVKTGGSVITRYLSNQGYVTGSSDSPANTSYSPRIVGGIQISRKINIDGNVSMSFGDIELNNTDGSLDSWVDDYWANRSLRIYLGDVSWARSDFRQVMGGITTGIDTRRRDRINIKLSDKLQRLNNPVSEVKLGGSTSRADDLVPLLFGECHNIEPLLVDPAVFEYQVHNGPIEGVFEVRDNGIPVPYSSTPATGKFRLDNAPSGTVTCSAQGYAPTQNFLQRSQEFDNVYWTKSNSSIVANGATAPDGTTTADKLVENTAASVSHFVSRSIAVTAGLTYTLSAYFKAGERTFGRMTMTSTLFVGAPSVFFDLSTGQTTTVNDCIATVTPISNGWYRVTMTAVCDVSGNATSALYVSNSGTSSVYTGDGTSGVYIWGAQFEQNTIPSAYVPTTTTAVNIFPRTVVELVKVLVTQYGKDGQKFTLGDLDIPTLTQFDLANPQPVGYYIKDRGNVIDVCNSLTASIGARMVVSNTGLLSVVKLDLPQNFVQYPKEFDNAKWIKSNSTITTDATTSPDGTTTADKLVENTANAIHQAAQNIEVTAGTEYTYSIYVKDAGRSRCRIAVSDSFFIGAPAAQFDLSTGTKTLEVDCLSSITPIGNGWFKIQLKATADTSGSPSFVVNPVQTGTTSTYTGDGTSGIYIWNAELTSCTTVTSADITSKSLEITQLVPVVASIKLAYCKNWTVQETLAAGLVINTVALFTEEWLTVTRTDTAAADNYNLYTDPVQTETMLLTSVDAINEANRRLAMFSVQRKVFRYTGFYHLINENLGAPQTIVHDRFGLAAGKTGQIISITLDLMSPHVQFEVLI